MFKRLLTRMIRRFESRYQYDAEYMHSITSTSSNATVRLLLLGAMNSYQGPNKSVWAGAALASTLKGDCGPCLQLMADKLIEQRISESEIHAALTRDWHLAGDVGLGFRFAEALLEQDETSNKLGNEITQKYGQQALIAAAYAATSYVVYPLLKHALGNAQQCTSVTIGSSAPLFIQPTRNQAEQNP